MSAPRKRSVRLRHAIVAAALCLLVSFVPLPRYSFVSTAAASTGPLPELAAASTEVLGALADSVDVPLEQDRLVGADEAVPEFSMLGMTFDSPPSEPVLARVVEADGRWSEWFELEHGTDDGPDPGTSEDAGADHGVISTEPVWVNSATGFELSVGADDADGAELAIVREQLTRTVVAATPLAEASPSNPLGVKLRSTWNTRNTSASTSPGLGMAVVHHTASSNNYSAAQVPSILRSIQAFHMDVNQWSDIAYNFVVDKFGGLWEGRGGGIDQPVIGAHARGFNTGSVGVTVIGNYVGTAPSGAAIEKTSQVVGWRLGAYGADPRGRANFTSLGSTSIPAGVVVNLPRVVGHRDVGATSCPGSIYNSMASIRSRAGFWYDTVGKPFGSLDKVVLDGRSVTMAGWTKDPDTSAPVQVHLNVGDRWIVVPASRPRPDVAAIYPTYGDNRGFEARFAEVPPGAWTACAYAINQGRGTGNTTLGCSDILVK